MHKVEQDRCLIQFLMGLNEVYIVVRGSILMMNPLPTMAPAFFILIKEEKQRQVKRTNRLHLESISLVAHTHSTDTSRYRNIGANTSNGTFRINYGPTNITYKNGGKNSSETLVPPLEITQQISSLTELACSATIARNLVTLRLNITNYMNSYQILSSPRVGI